MKKEIEGYVTIRLWVSTHAILRALAEYKGEQLTEFLDRILREEAKELGFQVNDKKVDTVVDFDKKEISVITR